MDYLYINAIVKEVYKDLPCGCPFPMEHGKTMYNTVSGFDCLSNPNVPDALSFFTVRSKGQAPALVFSRIRKHTNSASVGRFIQSIGWTWNGNLLFRNLDEVLNTDFYSEQEINDTALQGGSFPLPKDRRSSYEIVPISLSPRVKQAILTTVLLRWMRFDAPLRIAVPKNVDYISYVLSAIKEIYKIFPVSLRARAGFCSYLPSDKNLPETIFIGFVPEEMADSRTLSLDDSSPAACNILCCSTDIEALDTFIKCLANISDTERQAFLEEIYEDLEGSGSLDKIASITHHHYQTIGIALSLLTPEGSLPELKQVWDKQFFKNISKFSTRMQNRIRDKIRATIDPAEFCRLAERRLAADGFEGLKAYKEYCSGNPELADALWDTALRLQVERGKTYGEIYNTVMRTNGLAFIFNDSRDNSLYYLAAQGKLQEQQSKPLSNEIKELESRLNELNQLHEKVSTRISAPGIAALLKEIDCLASSLREHRNELIYNAFKTRFTEIQEHPTKTVEQIEKTIGDTKDLLKELELAPQTDKFLQLRQAMTDLVTAKEEQINSSYGKFMKIDRILANPTLDYFAILEELGKIDKSQLEERHHRIIDTKLVIRRDRTLELYGVAFSRYYNKPLTLSNMAALPDYVFVRVAQDICQLKQLALRCTASCNAAETADRITGALAVAGKLSDAHTLDITYNGSKLKSDWFRNLLRLNLDKNNMGNAQRMEEVFYSLVDAGAFRGSDLIGAVEMIRRCGLSQSPLFTAALRGSFDDATEEQYHQAFEAMVRSVKNSDDALEKMASAEQKIRDKNPEAVKAFREVQRAQKGKSSGKFSKGIIAIISALGALVIILSVILVLDLTRKDEAPVAPTTPYVSAPTENPTEIMPTESPIAYPEAILFHGDNAEAIDFLYGNNAISFAAHSSQVETLLDTADAELSNVILQQYNQYSGTDVTIDEAGTIVKWEEYFFWLLRCHADEEAGELLSILQQEVSNEDVLSMLRVIHHNLPEEETAPEVPQLEEQMTEAGDQDLPTDPEPNDIPTGPVPPEDSSIAGEPEEPGNEGSSDSTAEETKVQTTEIAGTEPPVSIADVKAVVIDSAAGYYESSLSNADRLLLVQKIFGADFTKDFSSHADLVASLGMIGDAQSPSFAHFLKHYQIMPGNTAIRFEGTDINVTWNEFVFWECWVLAQQGVTVIDAQTFGNDLYDQVSEVLSVVYQLNREGEYPAGIEFPHTGSNIFQSEFEINSVVLNIIQAAKESFEREQAIYSTIFAETLEQ